MSMMGPLKYFLRLQIQQRDDGIFINQSKYIQDLLKKYDMVNNKQSSTPMATSTCLYSDPSGIVDAKKIH